MVFTTLLSPITEEKLGKGYRKHFAEPRLPDPKAYEVKTLELESKPRMAESTAPGGVNG